MSTFIRREGPIGRSTPSKAVALFLKDSKTALSSAWLTSTKILAFTRIQYCGSESVMNTSDAHRQKAIGLFRELLNPGRGAIFPRMYTPQKSTKSVRNNGNLDMSLIPSGHRLQRSHQSLSNTLLLAFKSAKRNSCITCNLIQTHSPPVIIFLTVFGPLATDQCGRDDNQGASVEP